MPTSGGAVLAGGERAGARMGASLAEQPFDVAFHPGNNGIFVSGLITGAVSAPAAADCAIPIFRDVAAVCRAKAH